MPEVEGYDGEAGGWGHSGVPSGSSADRPMSRALALLALRQLPEPSH